jgi:hypothetical protein
MAVQKHNTLAHLHQVPELRVELCAFVTMCRPAAAAAAAVQALLAGGADVNARYRPPVGRTVTPLTWAAICEGANKNNTEYGYPGFSFEVLLEAGVCTLAHTLLPIACGCW